MPSPLPAPAEDGRERMYVCIFESLALLRFEFLKKNQTTIITVCAENEHFLKTAFFMLPKLAIFFSL